ncbi:hypothetical protein ES708_17489 [subsurface metagenome]
MTISGTVTGAPATVSLNTGDSQEVRAGGSFNFQVQAGFTYKVYVQQAGYIFDNQSLTVDNVQSDTSGVNFVGSPTHDQGRAGN